jgi:hypothetical protein
MANDYPKTLKRGPLRGQTFESHSEYVAALNDWKTANPDEVAPQGAEPGGEKRTRQRRPKTGPVSLEMAQGVVAFSNLLLSIIPATREDTLQEYEASALSLAIVETAKVNQFFANIVIRFCSLGSQSRLLMTVGGIVTVRLAKREIVPAQAGLAATMLLISLSDPSPEPIDFTVGAPNPNGSPEPMGETAVT